MKKKLFKIILIKITWTNVQCISFQLSIHLNLFLKVTCFNNKVSPKKKKLTKGKCSQQTLTKLFTITKNKRIFRRTVSEQGLRFSDKKIQAKGSATYKMSD